MKKILILIIGLILIFPGFAKNKPLPEILGRALINVWEKGNIETLGKILSPDIEYEAAQQNKVFKGIKDAGSYIGHLHAFSKDLRVKVLATFSTKNEFLDSYSQANHHQGAG